MIEERQAYRDAIEEIRAALLDLGGALDRLHRLTASQGGLELRTYKPERATDIALTQLVAAVQQMVSSELIRLRASGVASGRTVVDVPASDVYLSTLDAIKQYLGDAVKCLSSRDDAPVGTGTPAGAKAWDGNESLRQVLLTALSGLAILVTTEQARVGRAEDSS